MPSAPIPYKSKHCLPALYWSSILLGTLLFSLPSYSQDPLPPKNTHICYFSLNNEKEFKEMKKFSKKLNAVSPRKITVSEYQTKDSDPSKSFKKMIQSGVKCDALVISGHHTGSFGGQRSNGSLSIDFLEKLSCNPKYQKFFENIKALWLQGCRTLGTGEIRGLAQQVEDLEELDQEVPEENADGHMNRVGALLDEDFLEQSLEDLNVEFSATLDQDNPLSSRYLRVFPRAAVFGWTKTAPGEKSQSEFSIPYHIANLARLTDDRKTVFENPAQEKFSKESALHFAAALNSLINPQQNVSEGCKTWLQDQALEAWFQHGRAIKGRDYYGFDNADLQAHRALLTDKQEALLKARHRDCELKNLPLEKLLADGGTLDQALKSKSAIAYNFNSIWELIQRLGEKNPRQFSRLQNKLKNSSQLLSLLRKKFRDPQLGVIRKIDYYAFYRDMMSETTPRMRQMEKKLLEKSAPWFHKDLVENLDLRDFTFTLLNSLLKNEIWPEKLPSLLARGAHPNKALRIIINYLNESSYKKRAGVILKAILEHPNIDGLTLFAVAESIGKVKPSNSYSLLKSTLEEHPKLEDPILGNIAEAISSAIPSPQGLTLLQTMIDRESSGESALNRSIDAIIKIAPPRPGDYLKSIIRHGNSNSSVLHQVSRAIAELKPSNAMELLKEIINHPEAWDLSLEGVVNTVKKLNLLELKNSEALLESVLRHDHTREGALLKIAQTIKEFPPKNAADFLRRAIYHPKNAEWSLAAEARALATVRPPDTPELLKYIVEHKETNGGVLKAAATTIGLVEPKNSADLLHTIITHPAADYDALQWAVVSLRAAPASKRAGLLELALKHSQTSNQVFIKMAKLIKDAPPKNKEMLLLAMTKHPKIQNSGLRSIFNTIQKTQPSNRLLLLQKIINHREVKFLLYGDAKRAYAKAIADLRKQKD